MKIFLAAFPLHSGSGAVNGSTRGRDMLAVALCEDGHGLGDHLSSSPSFAKHDIGLTSDWHHDTYREHCPNGYTVEWVDDPDTHAGWQAAFLLDQELKQRSEQAQSADAVGPLAPPVLEDDAHER